MLRIYVDFNTNQMYDNNRVDIPASFQQKFQKKLKIADTVLLYDESMEVEGKLYFQEMQQTWYAVADWSTSRDIET